MRFDAKEFGGRIRDLRKKKGITQEQLSIMLNISANHLAKVETGNRCCSIELLQDLAGKTAPQLHCSCGGKSGRVLSRNYSGFQDLRRVSQTAAASMGSIPIRPMGAGPNTL